MKPFPLSPGVCPQPQKMKCKNTKYQMRHDVAHTICLLCLLCLCLISAFSVAGSVYTASHLDVVKSVTQHSDTDTLTPIWSGVTLVEFDPAVTWSSGSCNTRYVVVRKDDTAVLSTILAAYAQGRKIRVYADDTARLESNYCFVRSLKF